MVETKEETYHGVWYLPDNAERKVQGYVLLTDFTVSLYLTDPNDRGLEEKANGEIDELKYPVVHGIGRYGEKITLYECRGSSDQFEAKLMLYGDRHYNSFHEQKFKILGVHIPLFDSWISNQSFRKEILSTGFSISYSSPEEINFDLDEYICLNIQFECFPPSTENRNKLTLQHFALVQFVSRGEEGLAFAELFKYLQYFQQLVSFLARDGANISAARVYSSIEDFKHNKFLGTMIYGALPFNKFQYDDSHRKYMVQKSDIQTDIEVFFKNWFVFASTGQHILNLIFLDYFYRGSFNENNFLNLVRALEIYHAYKFPGTATPPNEFKVKLEKIIEGIPEEYKKEVKDHLQYQNELNLDQRLTKLTSETENIRIGFDYKFDQDFKVKNARNYYTHYNPRLKKKASSGDDLVFLTESCRALLNFLILKHLGVSKDALSKRFDYYFENSFYSSYFL